jgi:hypothetical protein
MFKLFQIKLSLMELGSSVGRKQCITGLYKLLEKYRIFIKSFNEVRVGILVY